MRKIAYSILLLALVSCGTGTGHNRQKVAKVGDAYLYIEDLRKAIPEGLSREDSLFRAQQFIRSWVKEQLVFQKAIQILDNDEKDKKQELDNYYHSLIRHVYEEKMVSNAMLDTTITNKDVAKYYKENERNFELKRNIIRLLYVKLPVNDPGVDKARFLFKNYQIIGLDSLKQYVGRFADNMVTDTSAWFYFDDIAKEIPIDETYSYGHFIRNNTFVELKDSANIYLINIVDRRIKDDIAPLPLVRSRIKNILMHQQEVEFLQKLENDIYRDAVRNRQFEIYTK